MQVSVGHGFAAEIAAGNEGEIVIEPGQAGIAQFRQRLLVTAQGNAPPVADPGIALEYLEAGTDFVDTIGQGFQLRGFVDDIFRGGDLAAIVQPGGDVQCLPFIFGRLIGAEGGLLARCRRLGEHQGQFRHALAMAAGVGAFGVDGAGQQLNEGVQQLFLPGLQALAFDAHGSRAGHRLEKRNAVRPQLVQIALLAAVGQEQHQQTHGFVVAIVQADPDQMDPRTFQREQDFLQITRLLEPQVADDIVDVGQLVQPWGALRVLERVSADVEVLQVFGGVIDDQSVGFHVRAITFAQIDQAGLGLADFHGFKQHPFQQRGETGFGAEAVSDLEEARQGVFHSCHRHTQLVDFEHRRATGKRKIEIETANRIGLLHQGAQGFDQDS
ncbi:hypothetical protein D3C72_745690 [compost metagenome]